MTRSKLIIVFLGGYVVGHVMRTLKDRRRNEATEKIPVISPPKTTPVIEPATAVKVSTLITHDTVLRSLWAYDTTGHTKLVHVRFDEQTADLVTKFKMATGTDITKFVAFAVKYFFESEPGLKTIIKQFIQNTTL